MFQWHVDRPVPEIGAMILGKPPVCLRCLHNLICVAYACDLPSAGPAQWFLKSDTQNNS